MFTGIIEEVGTLAGIRRGVQSARITVHAPHIAESVELGDSVAVNGICLTAVAREGVNLSFDAVPETIQRTSLKVARPGDRVNLERALAVGQRIGGHFVQGHIDETGILKSIKTHDNAQVLDIALAPEAAKYLIPKGSIAVDGISLTVMEANPESFTVSIIPHTWDHTNLKTRRAGDPVNLEVDMLAKYVEKLLATQERATT
jgi:riboflavin synthase